ncbi:MAG: ATP-binding protein [Candidatus Nitrosotenuis sp.]
MLTIRPDAKIIIETARDKAEELIKDVIAQGAYQYLPKPIRLEKIKEIIETMKMEEAKEFDDATEMLEKMVSNSTQISQIRIQQQLGKTEAEIMPQIKRLLSDKKILQIDDIKEVSCPRCSSVRVAQTFHCPKCKGTNFKQDKIIEHYRCGNVSPAVTYVDDKCPKCHESIKVFGVDYRVQDSMYLCNDCGDVFADILLSGHLGELSPKQRERIDIIKSSSASLLQLISDLLDVQKLELGQLKIQRENVDIYDTVVKSIQTLQPQIEEQRVGIVNDAIHVSILHDPDRIGQVLTNLIKNSIKAVQPGSGMIRVYSEQTLDEVKIMVSDNGIGIPHDKQGKLFTKFYQADASMTREKGGSGLGLSICKGIVEIHGGKISMQSTPNSGTIVTFSLPKTDQKGAV